jgi:hypothetical protein
MSAAVRGAKSAPVNRRDVALDQVAQRLADAAAPNSMNALKKLLKRDCGGSATREASRAAFPGSVWLNWLTVPGSAFEPPPVSANEFAALGV